MAKKLPAIMFYTGDWLKDPAVGQCSPATRGIWMDLLCLAHENNRSGVVSGTVEQLARIARCTPDEMRAAVDELRVTKTARVTERHKNITIENRRMARESAERNANTVRQKRSRSRKRDKPEPAVSRKCRAPSSSSSSISSSTAVGRARALRADGVPDTEAIAARLVALSSGVGGDA